MPNPFLHNLRKFGFEFFSIFIGVFAAFALDNWNENRKDEVTEMKILTEISNGLKQDIKDLELNEKGHEMGLKAGQYYSRIINGQTATQDSVVIYYFNLFRDFISIQNISGYETLKSKGLEIVQNDSLRLKIIALYENDYNSLRKLEEDYSELQFHDSYFKEFNAVLAPNFIIDDAGKIKGIKQPIRIGEKEKKILLVYLWKMRTNRGIMLGGYQEIKNKVKNLQKHIEEELARD